ncbi:MAG TPA: IS1595 family transposase [Acetobacteraceae bacterium]|nr:IS1595 family transposase [Acetobacteraceae bacterium]
MARNAVQLQKGLSLDRFLAQYGSEEQCHAALVAWRWPEGFTCPRCGGQGHAFCAPRKLFQCSACRHQTSVRAGTAFEASKLPLRTWFLAIHLLTHSKNDIAALELMRQLGVKYDTAWLLKQKLLGAMQDRNQQQPLSGVIQIDDATLGGEATLKPGDKRGRGAPNKIPFLVAVATRDGKPVALHLRRVEGLTKDAIRRYASTSISPGSLVVSDGLSCFNGFDDVGLTHRAIKTGSGKRPSEPALTWPNTVLGNVKAAISGTCRAFRPRHASRYLAGFEYRFNRRTDLATMPQRLATDALHHQPLPATRVKTAEV